MRYIKNELLGDTLNTGIISDDGRWFIGLVKQLDKPKHVIKAEDKEIEQKENTSSDNVNVELCQSCKKLQHPSMDMCKICPLRSLLKIAS